MDKFDVLREKIEAEDNWKRVRGDNVAAQILFWMGEIDRKEEAGGAERMHLLEMAVDGLRKDMCEVAVDISDLKEKFRGLDDAHCELASKIDGKRQNTRRAGDIYGRFLLSDRSNSAPRWWSLKAIVQSAMFLETDSWTFEVVSDEKQDTFDAVRRVAAAEEAARVAKEMVHQ